MCSILSCDITKLRFFVSRQNPTFRASASYAACGDLDAMNYTTLHTDMLDRFNEHAKSIHRMSNGRMLYIGAGFYMHDCENPRFRYQDKSLARFEEVMKE